MKVTEEKLKEFVADRMRYFQGSLDCHRSGIDDPENSKYKASIDAGIKPHLKVNRPRGEGEEETPTDGMQFVDDKGVLHKAFLPGEKLVSTIPEGLREDSFGRILRASIIGNREGLNYEEKSLSEGIGASGGFLLPDIVSRQVWDLARNQAFCLKAGMLTLMMDGPIVKIVKCVGDPTGYFVAENEEITEDTTWEIAPVTLQAITCGIVIKSSIELLEDAPNASAILQNAIGKAIALKLDLSALTGDGVNSPLGIGNYDDRNVVDMGTNGLALTDYDPFSEACEAVANANGIASSVIMAPRSAYVLDRLKEGTTNAPLPAPQSFVNLDKYITNQVSVTDTKGTSSVASRAYIADWKQALLGIRKNLEIEVARSGGDTFSKCQLRIRGRMRFDIAIMRPDFFSVIEGIIPA